MENKVGLYRALVDASCAISQNLGALAPFMGADAVKSARESLREICSAAINCIVGETDKIFDASK